MGGCGELTPASLPQPIRRMDIGKMLSDLRAERAAVEESILVLERLALGRGKRRGRPPAWLTAATPPSRVKKAYTRSTETRARMARAQRRRWAKARKPMPPK